MQILTLSIPDKFSNWMTPMIFINSLWPAHKTVEHSFNEIKKEAIAQIYEFRKFEKCQILKSIQFDFSKISDIDKIFGEMEHKRT